VLTLQGGGFQFNLDDSFVTTTTEVNPDPFDFGDDEVQFPPGCTIDDQGIIRCDKPPSVIQDEFSLTPFSPEKRTFFDIFNLQTLERESRDRATRGELIEQFPTALGLFDIIGLKGTERIPLSFNQLRALINTGQEVRLSSQLFEELPNVKSIFEAFA